MENDYLAVRKKGTQRKKTKKTNGSWKAEKHMSNLNNVIECQLGHLR